MQRILLAGATGYLGGYIAKELKKQGYHVTAILRNKKQQANLSIEVDSVIEAQVTQAQTLENCCENIDVVISCVGITRQKDNQTYMDVDYQANKNLLDQAVQGKVKKFIYISAINAENLRDLKICDAKERFADELVSSGLDYCVVRPHGFFSDMTEFYEMAKKGRVYLFGNGHLRGNPIHGADLAKFCVECIETSDKIVPVGGPEFLSHNEIAAAAFNAIGATVKITYIPDWVRRFILRSVRVLTGSKVYGPIEFFLTVMALEMHAPEHGEITLSAYFKELANAEK